MWFLDSYCESAFKKKFLIEMKIKGAKAKKSSVENIDEEELQNDYILKPEKGCPKTDTSNWPLLLKVNMI